MSQPDNPNKAANQPASQPAGKSSGSKWQDGYRARARSGTRQGDSFSVGELMNAVISKNRIGYGMRRAAVLSLWPQAVGEQIAAMTRARAFEFGVLQVEARDSAVAHHLSMQRHHFIQRLNALLLQSASEGEQPDLVQDIRFGTGFQEASPSEPEEPELPSLAPEEDQQIRQQARAMSEDSTLAEAVAEAAVAVQQFRRWRELQGWPACPICGEPSRKVPCRACEAALKSPSVRRAADALIKDPNLSTEIISELGHDSYLVARHIAVQGLEGRLRSLALECIQSGEAQEYHAFANEQALKLLALQLEKPISQIQRRDYQQLPEEVRQMLWIGRSS